MTKTAKRTSKSKHQNSEYIIRDFFNTQGLIFDRTTKSNIYATIRRLNKQIRHNILEQPHIKLWVDGSYNSKTQKGGIGIVILTDENYPIDQIHNICYGKACGSIKSSIEAEIFALSVGISYVLDKFKDVQNLQIYYDSISATNALNVNAYTHKGTPYTNLKSALKRLKRQQVNTIFTHTKAHENDGNNILCDLMAKNYSGVKLMQSQKNKIIDYL